MRLISSRAALYAALKMLGMAVMLAAEVARTLYRAIGDFDDVWWIWPVRGFTIWAIFIVMRRYAKEYVRLRRGAPN